MEQAGYFASLKEKMRRERDTALFCLEEVDSTNRFAKEKAPECGKLMACALRQTAGRGRLGRHWVSPEGNLYVSFAYENTMPPERLAPVTLAVALAVCDTLADFDVPASIKWPNDIYIKGKKVCGILVETVCREERIPYIVAGIGINVNQREFPAEVEKRAISLWNVTGQESDRAEIAWRLKKQMDRRMAQFMEKGFAAMREEYMQHSLLIGREVTASVPHTICGICVGVSETGDLLLEAGGKCIPVTFGEVTGRLQFEGMPGQDRPGEE